MSAGLHDGKGAGTGGFFFFFLEKDRERETIYYITLKELVRVHLKERHMCEEVV